MALEERDFDVIVVGGGCAGTVAAYVAAKKGKSVLLIERGEHPGSKNMTGGRLYAHSLRKLLDTYAEGEVEWSDIPFERKITHERIALMDPHSNFTIDFTSKELGLDGNDSYSVLRSRFDQWLADLAESAGAEIIPGIPVETLLRKEDGTVYGVRAGDDELTAHVVIDAEGTNSLLAERDLGVPRLEPHEVAVGIKHVYELAPEQIEDRFLLPEGEGAAMLYVGDCTHGVVGGGFVYTNTDTISLGLVATVSELQKSNTTIYQALADFEKHPAVAPLIRGAELVEHSGHLVPEGGYDSVPEYVFDGALLAGDTMRLVMNLGYQVRGMDFAIASGQFAAEAACEAIDREDVSAAGLATYRTKLENSFVLADLKTFRKWPHVMEEWTRLFSQYPTMVAKIFNAMFVVDGKPQEKLIKRIWPIIRQMKPLKLANEVRKALMAL
ncbi:MAG: FAD-dependent oxidoreductase [Actinomycetaceae bacterium]|nr:FAD-dependent oxidoreductase [Arcanobacterium sp.]MDD7504381.1 FAD-dependent oxidoreductase [Actinomycetaceae bacterium]MDY6143045.1 FAD-dependent oxidoreductase [Arcanobacterium sp.]